jgi:hypothetical protein
LWILREQYRIPNSNRLVMDLLWTARFDSATDPKDRVFALLGLATDVDLSDPGLEISYNPAETVAEVYTRVARSLVCQDSGKLPDLLYEAGAASETRMTGLPSWVPDWSCRRSGSLIGGIAGKIGYKSASALEMEFEFTPQSISSDLSKTKSSDMLILKAATLDWIQLITPPMVQTNPVEDVSEPWLQHVKSDWETFFQQEDKAIVKFPKGPQNQFEALWRTLISNRTRFDEPAPASYAAGYVAFMKYQKTISLQRINQALAGDGQSKPSEAEKQASILYGQALQNSIHMRSFMATSKGYIGLVPSESSTEDKIVLIAGCAVPFVVRRIVDEPSGESLVPDSGDLVNKYQLLGECYVHGIMDSTIEQLNGLKWERIGLV